MAFNGPILPACLCKGEQGDAGVQTILRAARRQAELSGKAVTLIIVDTFARALAGDDENSSADVAAFVSRFDIITRATGAAVLVVHPPAKMQRAGRAALTLCSPPRTP
jgi:RecA-family ATPase